MNDRIELSPDAVEEMAVDRVRRLVDPGRHHDLGVDAEVAGEGCTLTVRVTASSRVDELFGRAVPGSDGQTEVRATSTASPRQLAGGC